MPSVELNGIDFQIIPTKRGGRLYNVFSEEIEPYSPSQRETGVSALSDLTSPDNRVFRNLIRGFGRDRTSMDTVEELQQFFDSRCDTRFETDVRIGHLGAQSTDAYEVVKCSAGADFNNNIYTFWEDDDGSDRNVLQANFNGADTTWKNGVEVFSSTDELSVQDAIVHKATVIVLFATNNDYLTRRSTNMSSWSAPSTEIVADLMSGNVNNHHDVNFGRLTEVGGELIAVVANTAAPANGTITFFSSVDAGNAWVDELLEIAAPGDTAVPANIGPLGVANYAGTDGQEKLYVLTSGALWEVDTAPNPWTSRKVFAQPIVGSNTLVNRLAVHGGKLWIGLNADSNTAAPVWTLDNKGGVEFIDTNMGLDRGDGPPSDLLGSIRSFRSAGKFLFASVGGEAANRNARIICHNGFGWHHMYRHGTANLVIDWLDVSARNDGTTRLHFAVRTAAATSDTYHLDQPLAHPASGVSIPRASLGLIDLPYVDGGMPTTPAAWQQVDVDAGNLGSATTGSYIDVSHGLNAAARTTTDLGDVDSSSSTRPYASGAGESGNSDGLRLTLQQGSGSSDNTDTPHLRSVRMDYDKRPPTRERFIFTVDLDATAEVGGRGLNTVEGVRTALTTARDLNTNPTLVYGSTGTRYVRVRPIRFWEEFREAGSPSVGAVLGRSKTTTFRHGLAEVVCEEVV